MHRNSKDLKTKKPVESKQNHEVFNPVSSFSQQLELLKAISHRELNQSKDAFKIFYKLANEGHREAQFHLGKMYQAGEGCKKSESDSLLWFSRSADQDYEHALAELGSILFMSAASAEDKAKAINLLRRGAAQDNLYAYCYLGVAYLQGNGCDVNEAKAFELFRRAADQNLDLAQYQLGLMYLAGKGCVKDEIKALQYITSSVLQEFHPAIVKFKELIANQTYVEKSENQRLSDCREKAIKNDINAQFELAVDLLKFYSRDKKIDQEAQKWLTEAAKGGHVHAAILLYYYHRKGLFGFKRNKETALFYLEIAAERKNVHAQLALALEYERNQDTLAIAISLYIEAMTNGCEFALINLQRLNKKGCLSSSDKDELAKHFLGKKKPPEKEKLESQKMTDKDSAKEEKHVAQAVSLESKDQAPFADLPELNVLGDDVATATNPATHPDVRSAVNARIERIWNHYEHHKQRIWERYKHHRQIRIMLACELAMNGDIEAQRHLAYCFLLDEEHKKEDEPTGVFWLIVLSDQGDAEAQYNLGVCLRDGIGVAKDEKKANAFFKKSAEQGYEEAQAALSDSRSKVASQVPKPVHPQPLSGAAVAIASLEAYKPLSHEKFLKCVQEVKQNSRCIVSTEFPELDNKTWEEVPKNRLRHYVADEFAKLSNAGTSISRAVIPLQVTAETLVIIVFDFVKGSKPEAICFVLSTTRDKKKMQENAEAIAFLRQSTFKSMLSENSPWNKPNPLKNSQHPYLVPLEKLAVQECELLFKDTLEDCVRGLSRAELFQNAKQRFLGRNSSTPLVDMHESKKAYSSQANGLGTSSSAGMFAASSSIQSKPIPTAVKTKRGGILRLNPIAKL